MCVLSAREEGIGVVRIQTANREVFNQWPFGSEEGYRYIVEPIASVKPGRYGLLGESRAPLEVVALSALTVGGPIRSYTLRVLSSDQGHHEKH